MLIGSAPRLESRRLPVAGPAARRPAGRGRRRRPRLPRLRVRRPRRPPGTRSAACARSGRATCSWSGSSTASAATSPTWSTPCRTCRPGGVGLRVLTWQGAQIDTTTAAGRLVFGIFAALAEFERELDSTTQRRCAAGCGERCSPEQAPANPTRQRSKGRLWWGGVGMSNSDPMAVELAAQAASPGRTPGLIAPIILLCTRGTRCKMRERPGAA